MTLYSIVYNTKLKKKKKKRIVERERERERAFTKTNWIENQIIEQERK